MSVTIDQESGMLSRQAMDIENMRDRFVTSNGLYTFPSPSFEALEKNLFFLLSNSKEIKFDSKYSMKPEYLSHDEYNTNILWQLLMYVNNVFCKEEFILSNVTVPSFTSIITICQDNFPKRKSSELEEVDW